MQDPVYWVLVLAGAAVVTVVIVMLARGRGQRPDLAEQAAHLLSGLMRTAGTQVVDYCVSGDATCAIGIDKNSRSLLLRYAGQQMPTWKFSAGQLRAVEIVEDHETMAKTVRGGADSWRSSKPRVFSTVRTLVLRIEVDGEQPVHTFNLIGSARGIHRTDPVYQYALQAGERWFELISGLMQAKTEAPLPRLRGIYASRADLAQQLQAYMHRQDGSDGGDA